MYRDSTLQAGRDMRPEEPLFYKGQEFPRRGTRWPILSEHAARLSPDGSFLAVDGWDGEVNAGGDLADIFNSGHIEGNYYVDIYAVASATVVLSLSGHFKNVDPLDLFRRSAWISKRYYILPLDYLKMDRFVLCDVQQAAGKAK